MKSRGWVSLLLAAVVGLCGQRADASYARLDTGLPAIESSLLQAPPPAVTEIPADAWIVESIIPLGTTADGQPLALISLLIPNSSLDELAPASTRAGPYAAPETHTRVFCIVQPPLGLWYLDGNDAVAEAGDTLGGLAQILIGNAMEYDQFNFGRAPKSLQIGDRIDVTQWSVPLRQAVVKSGWYDATIAMLRLRRSAYLQALVEHGSDDPQKLMGATEGTMSVFLEQGVNATGLAAGITDAARAFEAGSRKALGVKWAGGMLGAISAGMSGRSTGIAAAEGDYLEATKQGYLGTVTAVGVVFWPAGVISGTYGLADCLVLTPIAESSERATSETLAQQQVEAYGRLRSTISTMSGHHQQHQVSASAAAATLAKLKERTTIRRSGNMQYPTPVIFDQYRAGNEMRVYPAPFFGGRTIVGAWKK